MIRRTAVLVTLMLAVAVSAFSAELEDPKEIISKGKERLLGLKNYSYTIVSKGWDFDLEDTANATENLTGEAGGSFVTRKFTKDVDEVDTEPKIMEYVSEFRFMRPYVLWMKINSSDYVPDVLIDGILRYNYVKNKKKFSVKARLVPIGIPREIDTESGSFFYMTWEMQFMRMENLARDIEPTLAGIEEFNGRQAYKIEFDLSKGEPKHYDTDYSAWKIPKEIHFKYDEDIDKYVGDKHLGKVFFYIDTETLDLLGEEAIQPDGEFYYIKKFDDIGVNHLSKRDMG